MRKVAWRGSYLARRDANNMRTLATLPSNVFRGARANGTLHRMSRCPRGTLVEALCCGSWEFHFPSFCCWHCFGITDLGAMP